MNGQHTQGLLQAGVSTFQGREVFTAVLVNDLQKIVALFGFCGADDEQESIANLCRFVAIWNACGGIETKHLELMMGDLSIKNQITAAGKARPKPLTYRAVVYRQQRDDLLAVLKESREALQLANDSPSGGISGTIWMPHRPETLFDFLDVTIAKAEGGAA